MSAINILALDVDGVLTDGSVFLGASGEQEKRLSFRDLDALSRARAAGLTLALVTGEQGPMVDAVAARVGIELTIQSAKDKLAALSQLATQLQAPVESICYVGDADRDADALRAVGLGLAPKDASHAAQRAAHRVLSKPGGFGAVEEAVEICLARARSQAFELKAVERLSQIADRSIEAPQKMRDEQLPVLAEVAKVFINCLQAGGKILLCGNGGSAADAQHVAGELVGRFLNNRQPWPAIALATDCSVVTAIANDFGYENVFARQVRALAKPGDVVVGISTSGRSPNVLRALEAARRLGAVCVGFTGSPGRPLDEYSDVCFRAPVSDVPRIQEIHILAWHSVCEVVETELTGTRVSLSPAG